MPIFETDKQFPCQRANDLLINKMLLRESARKYEVGLYFDLEFPFFEGFGRLFFLAPKQSILC